MSLRNSFPKRYTLRTRPNWICTILHVRAVNMLAIFGEYRSPDAELGVRAVCCGFRGRAAGVQGVELGCRYGVGFAGAGDVGFIIGLENVGRHVE